MSPHRLETGMPGRLLLRRKRPTPQPPLLGARRRSRLTVLGRRRRRNLFVWTAVNPPRSGVHRSRRGWDINRSQTTSQSPLDAQVIPRPRRGAYVAECRVAELLEQAHVALYGLLAPGPPPCLKTAAPLGLGGSAVLPVDAHETPGVHGQLPGGSPASEPLCGALRALGPRPRLLVSRVELRAARLAELVGELK